MYILLVATRHGQTSELLFAQIPVSDHVLPDLKFWSGDDKNQEYQIFFGGCLSLTLQKKKKKKVLHFQVDKIALLSMCTFRKQQATHAYNNYIRSLRYGTL